MATNERYVEIAAGHISKRGLVCKKSEVYKTLSKIKKQDELFHSWYSFDKELESHIHDTGSIANFKGVYHIDEIILDYDLGNLAEEQLLELVRFAIHEDMLNHYTIPQEWIQPWYSGTGFHIHIPNVFGFLPSTTLPSVVRATLTKYFSEADNIYDGARLIRAPHSFNKKGNSFKTPFTVDEISKMSIKEIKKIAKKGRKDFEYPNIKAEAILGHYIQKPSVQVTANNEERSTLKNDPTAKVTCMQHALNQGPIPGQRNETMMRISSWMKRNGMPKDLVEIGLTQWVGPELAKEAQTVVNSMWEHGYSYSCSDPIMAHFCDQKCIYYRRKDYTPAVLTAEQAENAFAEWIKKDFTSSSFNFAELYDCHDFWVYPGELVIIEADTGMGKTTWVQNLVAKLPHLPCLFLSLEVGFKPIWRKFAQMTHGLTKQEVNTTKINGNGGQLSSLFNHIQILDVAPEINRIPEMVAEYQPKILVVDTTDMINVDSYRSEIDKMNTIINSLKSCATQQDIIILAVHHVNKQAALEGWTDLHSAKGSTNVVQKADKVLAINGDKDNIRRMIHAAKARDESKIKLMFDFHVKTMKFEQVTHG